MEGEGERERKGWSPRIPHAISKVNTMSEAWVKVLGSIPNMEGQEE
jgi:hypothetical protein